ncbi:hypothetical protein KSF78_0006609 [Schistosoma japonicum]|nr:hypothetical protein KSF78_0006609 [Schistosoma japonicum]
MNINVRKEGIHLKTLTSFKCCKTLLNIKVTDIRVAEVAKLIDPNYGYQVSTIKNNATAAAAADGDDDDDRIN